MQELSGSASLPKTHLLLRHEWKSIQLLRAMAAVMVVTFHAFQQYPRFNFAGGSTGVDVFFAISGFVMVISTQQLRQNTNASRIFMRRRILRIMPLYWAVTVLTLALFLINGGSNAHSLKPTYILGSFLLIPVWRTFSPAGLKDWHPVVNPGWTLSFEMLFYLIFAFTLRSRRQSILLTGMLGLLVVFGFLFPAQTGPAVLNLFSPRLLEFLGGVFIGKLLMRGRLLNTWVSCLIVVIFVMAIFLLPGSGFTWTSPALGTVSTLLVFAAVSLEPFLHERAPHVWVYLGNASYSIYLSHSLVLMIFFFQIMRPFLHGRIISFPVIELAGIILSVAFGCLLSEFVEYPLHRRLMKHFGGGLSRKAVSQPKSA